MNTTDCDRLFEGAAERVHLFIRMRLGDGLRRDHDSLDVLQEAYAQALRSMGDFEPRGEGAFATWLCRIAENRIHDLADRRQAAKRRAPGHEVPISAILERARASAGPATAAARRERNERLEGSIARLPEDERAAVLQRWFEDRTVDEIAARLGRSPSAVRRLLGRAIAAIGEELRDVAL